jgi:hypothetical protein
MLAHQARTAIKSELVFCAGVHWKPFGLNGFARYSGLLGCARNDRFVIASAAKQSSSSSQTP